MTVRFGRVARRRILIALGVVVALVAIALVMITLLQRKILFPRSMVEPVANPGEGVAGLERWTHESSEGPVEAFFLPGDGVSADQPGPLVIFAHGNGELIDYWPQALEPYRRLGVSVLLPEYRGYGRSAGDPTELAITADFIAFYDRAVARPEVDRARVVFHGRSLGGGAVCSLGREREPAAYVLESTFTSVRAMARRYLLPGFLVRDPFDSLPVIEKFSGHVLVLHGKSDQVIPVSHGKTLARAAARGRLVLRQCGHNDCPQNQDYWNDIESLLRDAELITR